MTWTCQCTALNHDNADACIRCGRLLKQRPSRHSEAPASPPFVLQRAKHLVDRHLDEPHRHKLVSRLTRLALPLGLLGFSGQIPLLFLAPIVGVWVDRWNRRRTLVVRQILSMPQSLAFGMAGARPYDPFLDGISYLAVIVSWLAMRVDRLEFLE